jgi:RNA polymerase sigma-32 factor
MTNALVSRNHEIALAGPVGSLDAYIQAVGAIPVLSKEDEQALAVRLREDNDLDAARELVMAHLRFVVHIAKGYTGPNTMFVSCRLPCTGFALKFTSSC